jgi:hypothetical protein
MVWGGHDRRDLVAQIDGIYTGKTPHSLPPFGAE